MRPFRLIMLGLGLVALAAVAAATGWRGVGATIADAGPAIALIVAFHAVPLAADTAGWRALFARADRLPFLPLFAFRWAGESVNNLLPVGQVGGEVVRARLAAIAGTPAAATGATVVADMTLGLVTQILFAVVGILLLLAAVGSSAAVGAIATGIAVLAALVAAFFLAQRSGGIGRAGRLAARGRGVLGGALYRVAGGAARLDIALNRLYRERRRLAVCAAWRMASWFAGAFEVWLALAVLGHPVSAGEAIAIHSLAMAARSAAFAVPGGLGVQEGGYVAVAALLGVPPTTGLALALVRRVREVLFGLPGLLVWWWGEARRRPATA